MIEGWHPSQPDRIGYNVLVDGDWVGTFESVERAAHAARRQGRFGTFRIWRRRVALVPHLHSDNR